MIYVLQQSAKLMHITPNPSYVIAHAARVSTAKPAPDSAAECRAFVKKLIGWGHLTPLEFVSLTFYIVSSRAVSHEFVRHRLMSVVQQSQRYCDYRSQFSVIEHKPDEMPHDIFMDSVHFAHDSYLSMLDRGVKPEDARILLPECTATQLIVCCNLREFRHFIDLRTSPAAWSAMRKLANLMAEAFVACLPEEYFLIEDVWHKEPC